MTATREPQPLARIAADVVIIDRTTIQTSPADSVEDLLRREAGLQVSRNGGPGQNAGVFIRGASASSTVVLVDGVRVGSATLGQVEFESIGLAQVDHIEVLRGPASSLYGADAVGGVVQIFTRRGEGIPRLTAHAAVGGYRSGQADLGVSGAAGEFDYSAALGHERSDGVSALRPGDQFGNYNPDRDGYRRSTGELNLGFAPAVGHRVGLKWVDSHLDAQYDASEFLPPDYAQNAAPDFRNHLHASVIGLDYRGQLAAAWATTLQVSRNVDDLRSGGTTSDRFKTTREQATWQNAWTFRPDQQLVVAYEHLSDRGLTDTYDHNRSNNAWVAGYSGQFGANSLQADLRRDLNSVYGGDTTGRLGWTTSLSALVPGLQLRALAGTTFRAPSFNDLYYPQFGIATIRPERGRSVEAGIDWRVADTQASITLYRNHVRDLIGYESDPTGTLCPPDYFGCASNTGHARLQGATLSAAQRWGGFSLHAVLDFLDAKDTDTGQRLARRAAHQTSLSADYSVGGWNVGAAVQSVGSRPDGGVVLGGYATVDLSARWRFAPMWQVEAKLLNAADHRVEPARDYQGLGRQAWLGVRFDGRGI